MKMTLSKRDIGLLAGALGVILLVAVYSLVFLPFGEKRDAYNTQLVSLQETENYYVDLAAQRSFYESEITRMEEENAALFAEFPAGIEPETEIMYAVEMEENVDVFFPSLSYGMATPIGGAVPVEGEEGESVSNGAMTAYCRPLNMSYQTTYQGLKDMLNYTHDHENRMVIDTISVAYDGTTGNVSGSLTLNMYYLTGTDKVYEDPYVPNMNLGVDNIFGTMQ